MTLRPMQQRHYIENDRDQQHQRLRPQVKQQLDIRRHLKRLRLRHILNAKQLIVDESQDIRPDVRENSKT